MVINTLKEADVLMMAETHGIDPSTKGLYGFYIDCISNQLTAPVQEPVAWRVKWPAIGGGHKWIMVDKPLMEKEGFVNQTLYTTPPAAQPALECTRSHPHENMDAMCELRTEIARLTNENARLKAAQRHAPPRAR